MKPADVHRVTPAPAAPLDLDALRIDVRAHFAQLASWARDQQLRGYASDVEADSELVDALLAAARRGEEDTARLRSAVDAFLVKHPAQIGSKSDRDDYGSFVTTADLWALHEARLTALPPEGAANG